MPISRPPSGSPGDGHGELDHGLRGDSTGPRAQVGNRCRIWVAGYVDGGYRRREGEKPAGASDTGMAIARDAQEPQAEARVDASPRVQGGCRDRTGREVVHRGRGQWRSGDDRGTGRVMKQQPKG